MPHSNLWAFYIVKIVLALNYIEMGKTTVGKSKLFCLLIPKGNPHFFTFPFFILTFQVILPYLFFKIAILPTPKLPFDDQFWGQLLISLQNYEVH